MQGTVGHFDGGAAAPARQATANRPIRVLVVEDEGLVAMDLAMTLEQLGYEVVGRSAYAEAGIKLAAERRPDVVLMDIGLAGAMDGIEAAGVVKNELAIPVVFLTAHADDATVAEALGVQPDGYVVKPFDAVSIRAQVEGAHYRHIAQREYERAQRIREQAAVTEMHRLQEVSDLRARFVSMASHELHTPLTPIILSVQMLTKTLKGRLKPAEEETLRMLGRNLERLAKLVEDVLDAARLEANGFKIAPKPTDLKAIASNVIETFAAQAARHEVSLQLHGTQSVEVVVDEGRIVQVVSNLVSNAIKFTPAGGRVDVTIHEEGGTARITVQDTGVGLKAQQIEQLFEPFAIVHDPDTVAGQQVGLGLYLSRSIAQMHGGRLECSSQGPGTGATFTLSLPTHWAPAQQPRHARLPESARR